MSRVAACALGATVFGALAAALCFAAAFAYDPGLTFEMDRDLPSLARGFYPVERHQQETFVWTSPRADLWLPAIDRRVAWRCSVRLRGARPHPLEPPIVSLAIDDVILAQRIAPDTYEDIGVSIPPRRTRQDFTLTIMTAPPFVPGPADRRELGVQVARLACAPAPPALVLPSRQAVTSAAIAGGAFGLGLALTGTSWWIVMAVTLLVAVAQSVPFSIGAAPYDAHPGTAVRLAIWISLTTVVVARLLEWLVRRPLQPAAGFVLAFSGAALYLKLLALLHPSKLVIDALFHAHRFEWVLGGRWFFTQPMPDGVQFPYAIALYVVAAPWSLLTHDYVSLLRIVVSSSEAVAGLLLYPMIVRTWGHRGAGAAAVVLFHLVPLPYTVVGNANMTNAFGQSAALVAIAAATVWTLHSRSYWQLAGLVCLISVALLSHVSTFALLTVILLAAAALYRYLARPRLAVPARLVALATVMAAVISVASYYGHFTEAYRVLDRVRGDAGQAASGPALSSPAPASGTAMTTPLRKRLATAGKLTIQNIGWPILLLAAAGLWRLWIDRRRDRLGCILAGWGTGYLVFAAFATLFRAGPQFERYLFEFIGRVDYAVYPAAVILGAYGAAWAWSAGWIARIAAAGLISLAGGSGLRQWRGWLE